MRKLKKTSIKTTWFMLFLTLIHFIRLLLYIINMISNSKQYQIQTELIIELIIFHHLKLSFEIIIWNDVDSLFSAFQMIVFKINYHCNNHCKRYLNDILKLTSKWFVHLTKPLAKQINLTQPFNSIEADLFPVFNQKQKKAH